MSKIRNVLKAPLLGVLAGLLGFTAAHAAPDRILNVSYDVARELFAELNPVFGKDGAGDQD
jgi:sulfate transport system substrate-binding protein